jgi:oxygen-independent coproporphyrinogen-3 oxidase
MGLYIHVPFCKTKCPYCDFNTYQGIESLMDPFRDALIAELSLWGQALGRPAVRTVFFGGGTPSYLPEGDIGKIIHAARDAFAVDETAEITIEANPGDLDSQACTALLRQGVNRLSIGVQSLNNDLLNLLGRRHHADEAVAAFETARNAGFANVNLDLMYGLPNQTMAQWQDTVDRLIELAPQHISMYALTLEEGTPMHRWTQEGKIPEPNQDLAADMYLYAQDALENSGYHHYEISNWSRDGLESQHNTIYWLNQPYLGVGPGAHSRLGEYRFWTMLSPRDYVAKASEWHRIGQPALERFDEEALSAALTVGGWEQISQATACTETMFLGLRLLDGLDLAEASAAVGEDLAQRYQTQIQELTAQGMLERRNGLLCLTKSSYLVANQAFTRFLD